MSSRDYSDPVYKLTRRACLKRDKNRCQMPGCTSKPRCRKNVHHIHRWSDSPHLRYEVSNCITLCVTCHKEIKDKEIHYVSLFEGIVRGYN